MSMAIDFATLCDTVCGGEICTNRCHFAVITVHIALACHFMASYPLSLYQTIEVLVLLATLLKSYMSKMVGNLAGYSFNSWSVDKPKIAIESR